MLQLPPWHGVRPAHRDFQAARVGQVPAVNVQDPQFRGGGEARGCLQAPLELHRDGSATYTPVNYICIPGNRVYASDWGGRTAVAAPAAACHSHTKCGGSAMATRAAAVYFHSKSCGIGVAAPTAACHFHTKRCGSSVATPAAYVCA